MTITNRRAFIERQGKWTDRQIIIKRRTFTDRVEDQKITKNMNGQTDRREKAKSSSFF